MSKVRRAVLIDTEVGVDDTASEAGLRVEVLTVEYPVNTVNYRAITDTITAMQSALNALDAKCLRHF